MNAALPLNYKVMGNGRQYVLILHGLMGSLDNWQGIAKVLAEHFTVVIVDLRNHGKSPHALSHTYADMCHDVITLCDQLQIVKTHIIGHSMGGKLAMYIVNEHPYWVDKLIVADIAPKQYPAQHNTIFKALKAVPLNTITNRTEAENILRQYIDENSTIQFLLKSLTRAETGFAWKFNLPVLEEYYDVISDAIEFDYPIYTPTLFLRGDTSDYISEDDYALIETQFLNSSLQTVSNAGHWLHADNSAEFIQKVTQFLL